MKYLLLAELFMLMFFTTCKIDLFDNADCVICRKNCAEVIISGNIIDKSTNKAVSNYPVDVTWIPSFLPEMKINSTKSDANGRFYLKVLIDTTLFENNVFCVKLANENNSSSQTDYLFDEYQYQMYKYAPNFQNLNFGLYPGISLKIILNRTKTDSFESFSVRHWYSERLSYDDYLIYKHDSSFIRINTQTAADVYTIIEWTKVYSPGKYTRQIDSVIFKKNGDNTYKIDW